jgi:methylenetetrahydrofolate reductase (NADPH)
MPQSKTSFKEALRTKDFVVTAELPLTPVSTSETILADAELLRDSVDGYLLTDNQYGQPHMAPAYAAGILKRNGYAPLLQLSSRNRNRIALIGELLGARATGLDALILVRGAILPEGYEPRPGAVMDTDAKDLIATARLINEDTKLGPGDELLIGTSATVHDPAPEATPAELLAKADAGAQLVVTQICLSIDVLRRYMSFLISHDLLRRFSVVATVAVVTSSEIAIWLRENRRGTIIPDALLDRLVTATDAETAAIEYTAALVQDIHDIPGVAGINFAAAGELRLIPAVLAQSGIPR